ncbi:glutathione S-transferase N-terminal domain-containing protein [Halohasta litorea]|uniref:Glutathione S-transferase N-terminal domain-containing protein n=1 Tax=Halohasta litorea TaxID=869891 RepID=A0ABD6D2C7_9EURY|nr:glutathione S-transferase N-terminal domain-containing protein [Halohasta litorea]
MTASAPQLELYNLQGCPYCKKVRRALDDLGVAYETHTVPPARSDRTEVYAASGQYGVPVLVDHANDIEGMAESDDIVDYLYAEYGDGETPPPSGIVDRLLSRFF